MIERLLETWLTKANERSFQIPFCHALAARGHTILHMSRHCGVEFGKDILTIGPDKVPCAYQLKGVNGGSLGQKKWQSELKAQAVSLVHGQLVHPSLPKHKHHRSFIVVNGNIEEEVSLEILLLNQKNAAEGLPDRKLETVVKGEMLQWFSDLQSDFWATNLREIKSYLELMLDAGNGPLNKKPLGRIFEAALPFKGQGTKKPPKPQLIRALLGAAIICASAIANYTNQKNHAAEFEAWTLLWAYSLALCERWSLDVKKVAFILELLSEAMYSSLANLCDELMTRDELVERNNFGDELIVHARATHVLGLMGIYGLWRRQRVAEGIEHEDEARDKFLYDFCTKQKNMLCLWGEAAIPQILAWNFYFRTLVATPEPDAEYAKLIFAILHRNHPRSQFPLASPYYGAEEALPHYVGITKKKVRENTAGTSWMLESLFYLFVRANWKEEARRFFPAITYFGFNHFLPKEKWEYYLLAPRKHGTLIDSRFRPPHSWSAFRKQAGEHEGKDVPSLMKLFPIHYLCFLCVVPYRVIPSGIRWLSTALDGNGE